MSIRVGINGFGRIGRLAARVLLQRDDIDLVAINAPDKTPDMVVYAFTHDTVHGRWNGEVTAEGDVLHFGKDTVKLLNNRDPSKLGWGELGCDYVFECTGKFLSEEAVQPHLDAGAKFVLMSAPAKDKTPMFVYGVNHESFDPALKTASSASCTTNCLAPVAKVLHDKFGIVERLMTTVHAATASQNLVDEYSAKNFRLGRSTYCNIIPTTTGAAKAVGKVIPELNGKLTGMAMRIPAADGSVVDLTVRLEKPATMDEINAAMKEAAEGSMKGVLDYETEEVVSSDFIGTTFASIYDSTAGIALNDHFVKLVAWYDNEMGFTQNMVRLMVYIAGTKGDK